MLLNRLVFLCLLLNLLTNLLYLYILLLHLGRLDKLLDCGDYLHNFRLSLRFQTAHPLAILKFHIYHIIEAAVFQSNQLCF